MGDVLVSEAVAGREMDALRASFDVTYDPELFKNPQRLKELLPRYRALIVRNQTQVNADVIAAGQRLLVIGRAGVGLDNVDHDAASKAGIVVTFEPEQNSNSVA
jgi:D-3-phosphoglycerate dehydrogenase